MPDETMPATGINTAVFELAELLTPAWSDMRVQARAAGLVCEGEGGEGGEGGSGGEGAGAGSGGAGGEGREGGGSGAADPDAQLLDGAKNKDAVKNALQRERDAAKAEKKRADELQTKVEKFEEAGKTETEKLTGERDKLKTETAELKAENLRLQVAIEKGLVGDKAALAGRLKGSTKEELAKDADELLKLTGSNGGSGGGFDGGARESAPGGKSMNDLIREKAGL